jgi:hypothetical protein
MAQVVSQALSLLQGERFLRLEKAHHEVNDGRRHHQHDHQLDQGPAP